MHIPDPSLIINELDEISGLLIEVEAANDYSNSNLNEAYERIIHLIKSFDLTTE